MTSLECARGVDVRHRRRGRVLNRYDGWNARSKEAGSRSPNDEMVPQATRGPEGFPCLTAARGGACALCYANAADADGRSSRLAVSKARCVDCSSVKH